MSGCAFTMKCGKYGLEQILMSATQTMEDVNTTVLILLAASTVAVTLATCWMGMDSTAVVSVSIALGIFGALKKH